MAIVRRILLGLVVLLLAASAAQAAVGRSWATSELGRLLEKAASAPGRRVAVQGLHAEGATRFTAQAITVADARGVWLRIEKPVLDWRPAALFKGRLVVRDLTASRIDMLRRPLTLGSSSGSALPPVPVHLDHFAAPLALDAPVAGQPLALSLDGRALLRRAGGPVDLTVTAPDGTAFHLSGTVASETLDLAWRARLPQLARWQGLAGLPLAGSLAAAGTLAGPVAALDLAAHAKLGRGGAGRAAWDGAALALRAVPVGGRWAATLGGAVAGPRWAGRVLAPRVLLSASGEADAAAGRLSLGQMRLQAGRAWASAFGVVDGWGRHANLVVSVGSAALQTLPGASKEVSGGGVLHAVLAGDPIAGRLRLAGTARGWGLHVGSGVTSRLLGPSPSLRLSAALAHGRLGASAVAVRGAGAGLWAAGRLWPRLGLWTAASVPALTVVSTAISGQARVAARIEGDPADPNGWGVADLALAAERLPPARGRLGFDLAHLARRPAGPLTADLRLKGHPLVVSARLDAGPQVRVDGLRVTSGPAWLAGSLEEVQGRVRGQLAAGLPDLARWRDVLGAPVAAGRLGARVILDPAAGQSAHLEATLAGLSVAGTAAERVQVTADLAGVDTGLRLSATASARDLRRGSLRLARALASLEGQRGEFRLTAQGRGPGRLDLAGRARLAGGKGMAELDRLALVYSGRRVALSQPVRLAWAPGLLRLSPARLSVGGGVVEAEGERSGQRLSGRLRLDRLPLALVDLVQPGARAAGRISGTASLSGTLRAPQASVALTGSGLSLGAVAAAGVGPLAARLDGKWRGGRLTFTSRATGNRLSVRAEGSLPLETRGPMLPPSGAVAGRLRLQGDASTLAILSPDGNTVTGTLRADLRLAGTVAAPSLSGDAALSGGRFENASSGTVVSDLAVKAALDGQTVRVTGEGKDGEGGRIRLDGQGDVKSLVAGLPYRATVALVKFHLLRRDDVTATVTGDLALAGQGTAARLTGRLTVTRAEINAGQLGGGSKGPAALKVVEINRPAWEVARQARHAGAASAGPLAVGLGLQMRVEHAFVRGRGLDSEWKGDLAVAGSLGQPQLTGKLSVVRGQYDLLGRVFVLQPDGTVTFLGGKRIDPTLAISARANTSDLTATATIGGTAHAPKVSLSSDPPLPKDEILSRLLFNTNAGNLSAFQQLQLAQMAASGLGAGLPGGGFDPLGAIRGALGLDVLQVSSASQPVTGAPGAATAAPTLSLGKYVGPNTFVRVDQGLQGLGQVTVEENLGHGFSLSTTLGEQEQGNGLGLNWRTDY